MIFFASTYLAMVSYDFDRSSDFFVMNTTVCNVWMRNGTISPLCGEHA